VVLEGLGSLTVKDAEKDVVKTATAGGQESPIPQVNGQAVSGDIANRELEIIRAADAAVG
jgi:hypothetical protein